MNETTKSLIRHIITATGLILAAFGATKWTGLLDIIGSNLDGVWEAGLVIVGFITSIIGFFKNRDRFTARTV